MSKRHLPDQFWVVKTNNDADTIAYSTIELVKGFEAHKDRDSQLIAKDIQEEKISPEKARQDYGGDCCIYGLYFSIT